MKYNVCLWNYRTGKMDTILLTDDRAQAARYVDGQRSAGNQVFVYDEKGDSVRFPVRQEEL